MFKRRTLILHSVLATTASLALALMSDPSAEAAPTISKRLADYQDRPNHSHQCAACCMFVPGQPDHCTMIEGIISPHGWCKYWQAGPADTCS
ncbi:hypothetical protein [Acidiphilium sp. PM]|uniref:hypothetical protein n=1 Tax=Acidiphilium sp. PM TaxID=1043206 RepID=UPI00068196A2|nr:hypothetical protein [Acidiphilium sp. PM]